MNVFAAVIALVAGVAAGAGAGTTAAAATPSAGAGAPATTSPAATPPLAATPPPTAAAAPLATARPDVAATPGTGSGLVLPPVPAIEPGFRAPAVPTRASGDLAGVAGPFVGLALDDAIGMALSRNTDLAVSQSERRVRAYQITAAEGAYDLRLALQPQYTYSKAAALSSFQAGPSGAPVGNVVLGATGGLSGSTGSGGRFEATTSAARINNDIALNGYDPYYETSLALAYTQPLARGRAIDDTRRAIRLAKINAAVGDADALVTASQTVDQVLIAYYNLVAAWKNVAIQEDALRQAKVQSQSNARLVRAGQAAPVDVVESDTQVNVFQDDVYSAIASVASYQNTLKTLILGDPGDPVWTANLVPTSPQTDVGAEPAVNDVVVAALKNRPEVARLRETIRQQNVNVDYASDQRKPQIDLNLGITENGFAGAPTNPNTNPITSIIGAELVSINQLIARVNATAAPGTPSLVPIPGGANAPPGAGTVGRIGQSFKTALQGRYPQYTISATVGLPLRNRTAIAQYRAEVERRQSLVAQEVGLIQRIQSEARNAVQAYRSARSRLSAASAARSAAEQVAASEARKFRAGGSTTFLVLQRQVAVANQRGRELQAQSDLQKALVEIDRTSGAILRNNRVDVTTLGTGSLGAVPSL